VRVGPAAPGDSGPEVQFHLGDHLGSSAAVADATGAVTNREEFTPYGETSFGSFARKRYRFTGKERDEESGLAYHSARYLALWIARWLAGDPLVIRDGALLVEGNTGSTANLFEYCAGNPLVYKDGTGQSPSTDGNTAHAHILPRLRDRINAVGRPTYDAEINVKNLLPGSTIRRKGRNPDGIGSIDLIIDATSGRHVYDLKPAGTSGKKKYDDQLFQYVTKLNGQRAAKYGTVLESIVREHPEVLAPIVVQTGANTERVYTLSLPIDPKTNRVRPGFIDYTFVDRQRRPVEDDAEHKQSRIVEDAERPPITINPSGDFRSQGDIDDDLDTSFDEASELEAARRRAQTRAPATEPSETAQKAARVGLWAVLGYAAWKVLKAAGGFAIAGPPGAVVGAATP
jgi:RHS repeat-associated protein